MWSDGVYSLKRLMPVPSRPHLRFFLFFVINVLIVLGGGQDCRWLCKISKKFISDGLHPTCLSSIDFYKSWNGAVTTLDLRQRQFITRSSHSIMIRTSMKEIKRTAKKPALEYSSPSTTVSHNYEYRCASGEYRWTSVLLTKWCAPRALAFGTRQNMRRKSSEFFTGNTIRWRLTSLVFERHLVFVSWSWDALILMQAVGSSRWLAASVSVHIPSW